MQQVVHRARQINPNGLESLSNSELLELEDRVTALLLAWQSRVGFVLSHCEKLLPPLITPQAVAERARLLERDGPGVWRPEDTRAARQFTTCGTAFNAPDGELFERYGLPKAVEQFRRTLCDSLSLLEAGVFLPLLRSATWNVLEPLRQIRADVLSEQAERTAETVGIALNDRMKAILVAILRENAVPGRAPVKQAVIAKAVSGRTDRVAVRDTVGQLKAAGLVQAKNGPGGGMLLTAAGVRAAESLVE